MGTGNRSLLCYDYIIQEAGIVKPIGQTQHKFNFTIWNLTPVQQQAAKQQQVAEEDKFAMVSLRTLLTVGVVCISPCQKAGRQLGHCQGNKLHHKMFKMFKILSVTHLGIQAISC